MKYEEPKPRVGPTGQRFDLIDKLSRDHSPEVRELLRRAGLSMNSELTDSQIRTVREFAQAYADDLSKVPGPRVRYLVLPSLSEGREGQPESPDGTRPIITKGESTMAKAKSSTRTKKSAPTKAQIVRVAKLRREGKTWGEVIRATDIKTNSTGFRAYLEEHGFDRFGRSNPNQATKAKGWGSAAINGRGKSKATKSTPKKATKATAKKARKPRAKKAKARK